MGVSGDNLVGMCCAVSKCHILIIDDTEILAKYAMYTNSHSYIYPLIKECCLLRLENLIADWT